MSLLDARAAIAHYFARTLVGVMVEQRGGPFTLEELQRWTAQAPALIVACLGVPKVTIEGGMSVGDPAWGVYVLARTVPKSERSQATLALVSNILAALPQQRWGGAMSKMAEDIGAVNLYSSKLDATGISLWCVRWRQAVDLPVVPVPALADFVRVGVTYQPSAPFDNTVVPAVDLINLPAVSLAPGTIGAAYSQTVSSFTGAPATTWTVTAGALPAGLVLNGSTGLISGTPTAIGTAQFTLQEVDNTGATVSSVTYITIGAST